MNTSLLEHYQAENTPMLSGSVSRSKNGALDLVPGVSGFTDWFAQTRQSMKGIQTRNLKSKLMNWGVGFLDHGPKPVVPNRNP